MHAVSPPARAEAVKGKNLAQTSNSIMGSTMGATGMMNTIDGAYQSSPFRDTIKRGMLTGMGMLTKPKFN